MTWHCDVDYFRPDSMSKGASSALGGPGSWSWGDVGGWVSGANDVRVGWDGVGCCKIWSCCSEWYVVGNSILKFPFGIFGSSLTVGSWNIERETVAEEGLLYGEWILRRPFTERKARSLNTGSPKWVSKTLKQSTQNRAPTRNDWLRILWVQYCFQSVLLWWLRF